MKKMLLLLIATLCCVALRASTFTWGATAYTDSTLSTDVSANSWAYLIKLSDSSTSGVVAYLNASFNDTFSEGSIVIEGATLVDSSQFIDYMSAFSKETALSSTDDYGTYAVLVYDVDSHKYGISSTVVTLDSSSFTGGTIDTNGAASDEFLNIVTDTTIQSIPEPTALVLLALGVAGVALKRRA